MKDIPVFTSEYGIASLVLREIPYRGCAYVHLRSSGDFQKLLVDCVDFCRACGADTVYATGEDLEGTYPLHTAIYEMRGSRASLPGSDAALWPVLPENFGQWRDIYNEKMAHVPNAAYITLLEQNALVSSGSCYFVHRDGKLLGIGKAQNGAIEAVISLQSGAGASILSALAFAQQEEELRLEVASRNEKAIRLYEKLGFVKTRELSRWYRVK